MTVETWLGRQDSNLGMAESKSDQFPCDMNTPFEKSAEYGSSSANRLTTISKCPVHREGATYMWELLV